MRKITVILVLFAFVLCVATSGEAETKKITKANFNVRAVHATKTDKESVADELKDIASALKNSTTLNTFKQLEAFNCSVDIGDESEFKITPDSLTLKLNPTKVEKDTVKGSVSVIKLKGKEHSVLVKANISVKVDGVLCIVSSTNYEGGELIIAIKLTSLE